MPSSPIQLDGTDIAILRALMKDGRKSFRQVSRETGISTPTVKTKFDKLVKSGLIKSISPILDMKKLGPNMKSELMTAKERGLKKQQRREAKGRK